MDRVDMGQTREKKGGRPLLTIFLVLLVALPIILVSLKEKPSKIVIPLKEGRPAPDFTFPDLDGRKVSLSDFRGKVVLVNIWAT